MGVDAAGPTLREAARDYVRLLDYRAGLIPADIARNERVTEATVRRSIARALQLERTAYRETILPFEALR